MWGSIKSILLGSNNSNDNPETHDESNKQSKVTISKEKSNVLRKTIKSNIVAKTENSHGYYQNDRNSSDNDIMGLIFSKKEKDVDRKSKNENEIIKLICSNKETNSGRNGQNVMGLLCSKKEINIEPTIPLAV